MNCSICLNVIDSEHIIKELSCGHKLHYRCYIRYVYRKNLFIECPLCRKININIDKPVNDPFRNIQLICSQKVGKVRCGCRTLKGYICKKKSRILNYGRCYHHNKEILRRDKYSLMVEYIYIILSQNNSWKSKVYLLDIGKKIIIKNGTNSININNILMKFYEYFSIKKTNIIKDYNEIYEYLDIEQPPIDWLNYCISNYIII